MIYYLINHITITFGIILKKVEILGNKFIRHKKINIITYNRITGYNPKYYIKKSQ